MTARQTPPDTSSAPVRRRQARRWVVAAALVGVVAIVSAATAIGITVATVVADLQNGTLETAIPPDGDAPIQASDLSKAALAARTGVPGTAEHDAATFLNEQPTAYWLTPESTPLTSVPIRIAHLANEARAQTARLGIVVYGLPDRDCGGHSAGGLSTDEYRAWTTAIGDALRHASDVAPIVVLEPDALALAPECGDADARVTSLRAAIDALSGDAVRIYVDGGHSQWLGVDEMARLIERLDADDTIRGFATNVSNFNATDDEIAYAHDLSERLDGLHAIIDTSRNGAGSTGEWCNPPGRLVGEPGGTVSDDVIDANLWIKPPGESDGDCNGGPPAGQWWPAAAVELTREVVP